jgi:bacteriorhodopsin
MVYDTYGSPCRCLTTGVDDPAYDIASKAAQIISGLMFAAFAMFLSIANSPPIGDIQKKSLAERLQAVTTLCFLVSIFSAFFNFFQVTEWDNIVLDNRSVPFVLDIARPVEWIMTCPVMQLALVIYGGKSIPVYRRILMPLLSVSVLVLGTASALTREPDFLRFMLAALAVCVCMAMFALNRYQIVEFSEGKEDLWRGNSNFHKVTVLLMVTWFPFPIWFGLSPECFGYITDVMLIQIGYAVLNIVSKCSFMAFLQYCKMNATRDVNNNIFHALMASETNGKITIDGKELALHTRSQSGVLHAVVTDALVQHGWGTQVERFLNLLKHAQVRTLEAVLELTEEQCDQKVLPRDMVLAVQSRLRKYKISEKSVGEDELEAAEKMYNTEKGKQELRKRAMGGIDPVELIEKLGQMVGTLFDEKMKAHEESMKESLNRNELRKEFRDLKTYMDTSIQNLDQKVSSRMESIETAVLTSKPATNDGHFAEGQVAENALIKMARQVETTLQSMDISCKALDVQDIFFGAKQSAANCTTQIESLYQALEHAKTCVGNDRGVSNNSTMAGSDVSNGRVSPVIANDILNEAYQQADAYVPFGAPEYVESHQLQSGVFIDPAPARIASDRHIPIKPQSPPAQLSADSQGAPPLWPSPGPGRRPLTALGSRLATEVKASSHSPSRGLGNSFAMSEVKASSPSRGLGNSFAMSYDHSSKALQRECGSGNGHDNGHVQGILGTATDANEIV